MSLYFLEASFPMDLPRDEALLIIFEVVLVLGGPQRVLHGLLVDDRFDILVQLYFAILLVDQVER